MLFMLLPLAYADTPSLGRPPCGSPATLAALGPAPVLPVRPPTVGEEKDERDAYGEFPNEVEGENFIVKWGTSGGVREADAEALLAAFEYAWSSEIEGMGHGAPAGSAGYLFNVYIGDTGSGTPDGYGTSGYYNRDRDGYPMIVVSASTLSDLEWARGTAVHEFYHSVQDATSRFPYTGDSAWYWEATAMWVEGEVLDNYEDYVAFLYGYALLPHLPVYFFDYPDTGALQEYHQYGAMIFPRYVSEIAADADVIRDSWMLDLGADTPQDALAQLLADRGVDFADAFGDFAARNAVWDYQDGELYDQWVDWYADYYRSDDHRLVARLNDDGTDGLVDAPEDTLPQRYGYNIVALLDPSEPAYTVHVEGAVVGSRDNPAAWRFTVVQDVPGGPIYTPIPLTVGVGEVVIEDADAGELYLVAAAVPEESRTEETFAWSYSVVPVPADEAPGDDTGARALPIAAEDDLRACGCDTGGAAPSGLLALGLLLVARRRR